MGDDLSLLFRLRADNTQAKAVLANTRQDVAQLRQAFGPDLAQAAAIGQKALASVGASVETLVSRQLPLLGSTIVTVSSGLRQVSAAASASQGAISGIGHSFSEIGAITGRTEAQVAGFISSLGLLKTAAEKNTAIVGFLGGALAGNLRPQLEEAAKAGADLNKTFQASGKSTDEALRLVQALGLIENASQRNAAAVAFFGQATAQKLLPQLERFGASLAVIAAASGRSGAEVAEFVSRFARLGTEVEKRTAAVEFFGASLATKLGPELTKTSDALAGVTAESAAAGTSIAAVAGPIGIAVLALAALAAGAAIAAKQIFDLAKSAAEYQGKLLDLSQQTGVAVETLSALDIAARTTGSSIEQLTQSLGIFQKNLEEAVEDRGSKAAVAFQKLGVDARDTETALRQTIAALAKMPEGFQQTSLALQVFGRGGKAFLAIAKESKGDIDEITKKLKNMGLVTTEQAQLADQFNDQLEILSVQLRGIGTEAIPVVLKVLQDLSKELEANRDAFLFLQGGVKGVALAIALPLQAALRILQDELVAARTILAVTAAYFERIKSAIEFIVGHPVSLPSLTSTPSATAPPVAPSTPQVDPFIEGVKDEIEARKRLQAVLNFDFAERQQRAQDSIALTQRELEAGKRTRQQALESTIDATRKQTQAQIDALQVERDIKLREAALAKDDLQKRDQIGNAILALDTQIANKRSEQRRSEADLRAKAQHDERKADLAHEQARADILIRLGEGRIAKIEELMKREQIARSVGVEEIEKIENASLATRAEILKKELALVGFGPDRQAVLDKIKALEVDRTTLERQQSERRRQITKEEFEEKRQILTSNLDALLQVEQIRGNARIAIIQAQAALRIKTEEQAAKEILAIRLRLLDSEIEATKAKEKAAAGIADPKERRQAQAQFANDLKILNAEREAIQAEGNRDIEDKRQDDLRNEREYWEDLKEIKQRIRDVEQDTAQDVIRLMVQGFARRKDIIRAQRDLDLQEEEDRHLRATDRIKREQSEVDKQIRILKSHLNSLKIGTTEEIEQHERLIEELEKLRVKRAELNAQQDAEDNRSKTRKRVVTEGANLEIAKPDAALQDVFDGIGESLTNLAGKFAEVIGAGKEFNAMAAQIAAQIGGALAGAFDQFANALGQTVANWVLLGETGPAVMRKILAQALASLAAEATVQAVKQLALGFATLFFNPAESAAHFTAAALWGSIAGVSAIAGRSVAGDLFKQQSSSGAGTSSQAPQPLETIAGRNQPQTQASPTVVHLDIRTDGGQIIKTWVDDFQNGGVTREVSLNDGR